MGITIEDARATETESAPQSTTTEYPSTGGPEEPREPREPGGLRRSGQRAWRVVLVVLAVLAVLDAVAFAIGLAGSSSREPQGAGGAPTIPITTCDYATLDSTIRSPEAVNGATLQFACNGVITFTRPIPINKTLTITGERQSVTLDGGGKVQVFNVGASGNFTLDYLTVANGSGRYGGGIYNNGGTLTITNSLINNNVARGPGGSWFSHGGDARGGGIYNNGGTLIITDSEVIGNYATGGNGDLGEGGNAFGGAIYSTGAGATVSITNSLVTYNRAEGGTNWLEGGGHAFGGAVYSAGTDSAVTITNSTVYYNHAYGGNAWTGGSAFGAGIYTYGKGAKLTITRGVINFNTALAGTGCKGGRALGGGVYNDGVELTLNTVDIKESYVTFNEATAGWNACHFLVGVGPDSFGGGFYNKFGRLTITTSAFSYNKVTGGEGFGAKVSLKGQVSVRVGGGYGEGGGVYNDIGMLDITDSHFNSNTAKGGPDFLLLAPGPGEGGGVANNNGKVTITTSTFEDNRALPGVGVFTSMIDTWAMGGGVYNTGSTLDITNSTVVNNSALTGGGVNNSSSGTVTITNSTFTANTASWHLGVPLLEEVDTGELGKGGGVYSKGTLTLINSIVVKNESGGATDCWGTVIDGGYNLTTTTGGCNTAGSIDGKDDPKLGSLANNGGPTVGLPTGNFPMETIALLPGSPAIDRIPSGAPGCGANFTDQRGITRPQGEKCDIGAFELDQTPPTTVPIVSPYFNTEGWNNSDVTVKLEATDNASHVKATYYTVNEGAQQTYDSKKGIVLTKDGQYAIEYWSVDSDGNEEVHSFWPIKLDKTAPTVTCNAAPADGRWHADNVSFACTTSDSGGSGLANGDDASFILTTNVATGTETADASTDSRTVTDIAGNSATIGPIGGNKVDRKAPDFDIVAPVASTAYARNDSLTIVYRVTDDGSGINPSSVKATLDGTGVSYGQVIKLSRLTSGSHTFSVTAADGVGNAASSSVVFVVAPPGG